MDNIIQALQYWGIEDAVINPTEQASETTWDINDKYILKEFRSFEDLSNSTKFSKLLTSYNIPVVKFIPTKNGEFNPLPVIMIVIEFLFAWFWNTQGNTKERTVALEIAM